METVVVGLVATGVADLWQQALKHGAGLPTANWRLIGRWVAGMSRGGLVQPAIAAAVAVPGEAAIGWTFHYLVGVLYAGLYLAIVGAWPGAGPSLGSALVFAAVTLAAPWLVMQPALGFGVMARRLPNRSAVALVTISTHLVFGVGLYLGVRVVGN
jgi:hypothetical protein